MVVLSLEAAVVAVAVADHAKKIEEEIALLVAVEAAVVPEMMLVKEAAFPVEVVVLEVVLTVRQVANLVVVKVEMVAIMLMKQLLDVVEEVATTVNQEKQVKMVD